MDLRAIERAGNEGRAGPAAPAAGARGLSPRAALRLKLAVLAAAVVAAIGLGVGSASIAGRLLQTPPAAGGRRISLRELETVLGGRHEDRADAGR